MFGHEIPPYESGLHSSTGSNKMKTASEAGGSFAVGPVRAAAYREQGASSSAHHGRQRIIIARRQLDTTNVYLR
jgi:hypothetical protein